MRCVLCVVLVGCTGEPQVANPTPCSVEGVTGPVLGVTIAIRSTSCVYSYGTGGVFTFDVVVDAAAPALHFAAEAPGCTLRPNPYTSDPLSLTRALIYDAERAFCSNCGGECAPAEPELTIQPIPGVVSGVIEWSGRENTTQNPGPYFEPGDYAVHVSFDGGDAGHVVAELPITVEP